MNTKVKLCKTSGLSYYMGGGAGKNLGGFLNVISKVEDHPTDEYGPRTKRAEFCSDRCRNLWRDVMKRVNNVKT